MHGPARPTRHPSAATSRRPHDHAPPRRRASASTSGDVQETRQGATCRETWSGGSSSALSASSSSRSSCSRSATRSTKPFQKRIIGGTKFVAFGNYLKAFGDASFVEGLWFIVRFSLVLIPIRMAISLAIALILDG